MNIAFVMLTYHPDEPAGIERSIASLAAGLREMGHSTLVIAANSADSTPAPRVVRLTSVTFPRPVPYEEIPLLLADTDAIGGRFGGSSRTTRRISSAGATRCQGWASSVLRGRGHAPCSWCTSLGPMRRCARVWRTSPTRSSPSAHS